MDQDLACVVSADAALWSGLDAAIANVNEIFRALKKRRTTEADVEHKPTEGAGRCAQSAAASAAAAAPQGEEGDVEEASAANLPFGMDDWADDEWACAVRLLDAEQQYLVLVLDVDVPHPVPPDLSDATARIRERHTRRDETRVMGALERAVAATATPQGACPPVTVTVDRDPAAAATRLEYVDWVRRGCPGLVIADCTIVFSGKNITKGRQAELINEKWVQRDAPYDIDVVDVADVRIGLTNQPLLLDPSCVAGALRKVVAVQGQCPPYDDIVDYYDRREDKRVRTKLGRGTARPPCEGCIDHGDWDSPRSWRWEHRFRARIALLVHG